MLKFIKKYLFFFITGSFSIILAACYGVPEEIGNFSTVKAKDGDGNPIKDLKVSLSIDGENQNTQYTNIDGVVDIQEFFLNDTTEYVVKIEDVDGDKNGGEFEMQEFVLTDNPYYEIEMEKK